MPDTTPLTIKIIEVDGHLRPETGRRTHVKRGQVVKFTAEKGATDLHIDFVGPSPFSEPVRYGTPLPIRKDVAPGQVFVYSCKFKKHGVPLRSEGGGDIEIDSGT